jgi:hypothetical protein
VLIVTGVAVVAVLVGSTSYLLLGIGAQPAHVISVPARLGSYAQDPALARTSDAQVARTQIVHGAVGEVKNVVSAVYAESTGTGISVGPQVIIFVGGNLIGGSSAANLISAFMAQSDDSFATSAGSLGGQAACAPGSAGSPAECAWADNDTFGVILSATLSAPGLASEMRQMRPLVEHVAK